MPTASKSERPRPLQAGKNLPQAPPLDDWYAPLIAPTTTLPVRRPSPPQPAGAAARPVQSARRG